MQSCVNSFVDILRKMVSRSRPSIRREGVERALSGEHAILVLDISFPILTALKSFAAFAPNLGCPC